MKKLWNIIADLVIIFAYSVIVFVGFVVCIIAVTGAGLWHLVRGEKHD